MKKLLILLLLLVSTSVFAEWIRIASNTDDDMTVYVDFGTIKKKGNKAKMWSLYDDKTVQKWGNINHLSQVSRNEYDCEEETKRILDLYLYSGNMRQGEVVYSLKNIKEEPHSIFPESIEEISLKIACFKKW